MDHLIGTERSAAILMRRRNGTTQRGWDTRMGTALDSDLNGKQGNGTLKGDGMLEGDYSIAI